MQETKGIVVGCSAKMEYLLPYFYLNLRLNSDLPIIFFDFGMTSIGKLFCEKRGFVIEIKETLYEANSFDQRDMIKSMWFKKPLAFQQACFDINLWLDLDCKILKPFEEIFDLLHDKWIAILEENPRFSPLHGYNSGVCVFRKNAPFIKPWIDLCKSSHDKFPGDQDVLSSILKNNMQHVSSLPQKFNYLYLKPGYDNPKDIVILHHFAVFKVLLQKEYLALDGSKNMYPFDPQFVEL